MAKAALSVFSNNYISFTISSVIWDQKRCQNPLHALVQLAFSSPTSQFDLQFSLT